jgi:hypothetical protein
MTDRTEPEKTREPAVLAPNTAHVDAETGASPEISAPMLDVHAPHQAVHSWKDFLIHIAAIALGLLMAIGLEQVVEYAHHRHQSEMIEAQMRRVLQSNLETDAGTLNRLSVVRTYLTELQVAISNHLQSQAPASARPPDYRRLHIFVILPGLAPFDAAKANGTVAWLPINRIRIYNRVVVARDLVLTIRDRWSLGFMALEEFQEQFVDSTGTIEGGGIAKAPDLSKLTAVQLGEYLQVVSALIKRNDALTHRLNILDFEFKQVLDGVADEEALVRAMIKEFGSEETSAGPADHG